MSKQTRKQQGGVWLRSDQAPGKELSLQTLCLDDCLGKQRRRRQRRCSRDSGAARMTPRESPGQCGTYAERGSRARARGRASRWGRAQMLGLSLDLYGHPLAPRGEPPEQGQRPSSHPHGHPAFHEARGPARLPALLPDWREPLCECLGWEWPGVGKAQKPWERGWLGGQGCLNWLGEGRLQV